VFKTALFGLARSEVMVLRALEAGRGAPESQLSVVFLNQRDEVVGRATQTFAPGRPATFQIAQGQLATEGAFPAVRTEMVLTVGGDGAASEVFLSFEFQNVDTLIVTGRGPSCGGKPFSPVGPVQFNCDGGMMPTELVSQGR
jgi:hypothetical protein